MDITYISEFVTLMEYGNFSSVAAKMNMSQPTLSKHIKAIEDEVGGTLIKRTAKGLLLTPLGEVFLPHAKSVLAEYEKMEGAVSAFIKDQNASFSLGIIKNLSYYDVVGYLVKFRMKYPDCTINVIETDDYKLKEMLNEGKLNLATVAIEKGLEGTLGSDVNLAAIGNGCITAVLPESCKWDAETIPMEEVCKFPLIVPEQTSVFARLIRNCAKNEGLFPNIVFEGSSPGCLDFTRADMGIALQSREMVRGYAYPGMRTAQIEPELAYSYGLAYRELNKLSEWEKRFVEFMFDDFKSEMKK